MNKDIKGKHVLIIGSGPSLKTYWEKINKIIEHDDNVVTMGCNNINHILTPDYHFWGSPKQWRKFGHSINKNSKFVFRSNFDKKTIREKWNGDYEIMNNVERRWETGFEKKESEQYRRCKVYYKNGKMYGCFKHTGPIMIFYSYIQGASKISVVGNDGYTLYSKKDLTNNVKNQHCYGEGLTDGFVYEYCLKRDMDRYRTLRLLHKYCKKKYGFKFEFLTPTVFQEFYNPNVLDIKEENKWEEPSAKEYKDIMNKYMNNRKIKNKG